MQISSYTLVRSRNTERLPPARFCHRTTNTMQTILLFQYLIILCFLSRTDFPKGPFSYLYHVCCCIYVHRKTSSVSSGHDLLSTRGSHRHEEWHTDLLGCCSEPCLCKFSQIVKIMVLLLYKFVFYQSKSLT